jgi:hypothetical protein
MLQYIASAAVVVAAFCLLPSESWAGDLVLADGGKSAYKIVIADNASPSTIHAAEELQAFLQQISNAKLPIVSDQQPKGPKEIILGDNAHLKGLGTPIELAGLGKEGYVIRTVGENLIIVGGALRGNLYGVYGFLEDHLGCRWFTPSVSRIPKSVHLAIGSIDDRQVPVLEYRDPYMFECLNGDWCARNRMNGSAARLDDRRGGKVKFAKGFFCHTFGQLVPPQEFFAAHPEYFAMIQGRRQKEQRGLPAQLCCTNPDVIRICTQRVREAMQAQPEATVFSVSQNDAYEANYCQCESCQSTARQHDSQIAPILQLVNCVAEAIEKDFPDKIVETLAYQYSRRAPKHMRPRPNVVVRLCSIECCFAHPLATCNSPQSTLFRTDIEAWARVAPRLWVWDYTTDFANYLLPFPNQRVLGPNVRFFVAHNVKGIFEEDSYDSADSEFAELGGYLMAKALWNPDYDLDRATNEFLVEYYVEAAGPIQQYIDMLHKRVERENIHVNIWAGSDGLHMTDELLVKANALWQQAEDLAATSPEVLQRVKRSRMSVDYAILERARLQAQKKMPASASLHSLAAKRLEPFCNVLNRSALTHLSETAPLDKEAYRRSLAKDLGLAD